MTNKIPSCRVFISLSYLFLNIMAKLWIFFFFYTERFICKRSDFVFKILTKNFICLKLLLSFVKYILMTVLYLCRYIFNFKWNTHFEWTFIIRLLICVVAGVNLVMIDVSFNYPPLLLVKFRIIFFCFLAYRLSYGYWKYMVSTRRCDTPHSQRINEFIANEIPRKKSLRKFWWNLATKIARLRYLLSTKIWLCLSILMKYYCFLIFWTIFCEAISKIGSMHNAYKPENINAFKRQIRQDIAEIEPQICRNFIENITKRSDICRRPPGEHLKAISLLYCRSSTTYNRWTISIQNVFHLNLVRLERPCTP